MRFRLYDLYFRDTTTRLRMYTVAYLVAISIGCLSLLLGSSAPESLLLSTLVSGAIISGRTYWYCLRIPSRSIAVENVRVLTPRRTVVAISIIAAATALGLELKHIEAAILNRKVNRLGEPKKMDVQAIESVTSAITYAKDNDLPGDPSRISTGGIAFLDLAPTQPKAWEAAQGYLGYRTNFNRDLTAVKTAREIAKTTVDPRLHSERFYYYVSINGFPSPQISVGGSVPIDRAVIMTLIGRESEKIAARAHDEVLLMDGGGLFLDDTHARHVIFRDATVAYDGGPLFLEDVIFVKCNFLLKNTPAGLAFARDVLTSRAGSITFKSPPQ